MVKRKSTLNIPTGVIRGSEEEKLQKQEEKKSQEEKIAEYLALLQQVKQRKF